MQNLLNSQSFLHQTPHTPFLEHPIEEESELEIVGPEAFHSSFDDD